MREYVVQSGPLRTFDNLYDPRFEKIRKVQDYHTIEIIKKPGTRRRIIAELNRAAAREIQFACEFFSPFAEGHRTIFGIRDIVGGNASKLIKALLKKDWAYKHMQYGISEDDLVMMEMKEFKAAIPFLAEFAPPTEGGMFFYLSAAPFDIFDIYWERCARSSLKSKTENFRLHVVATAHEAKIALFQDNDGSYTIVLHPKGAPVKEAEKRIADAGKMTGMDITFAPSLFS